MAHGTRNARQHAVAFSQADIDCYLLAEPGSRPRLGKWGVVAVVAGAILAICVVAVETYFATLF
jgi:hypothetical protein